MSVFAATRFGIVWSLGDWLIYNVNGDVEKSDNSDDVVSVNSQTGAVVLNTSNISEVTNLYYTEARVSANTDVSANTAKVSNITQDSIVGITGTIDEFNTSITDAILSGNNTGDQTLPTDFVSASSGGAFGGSISATNLSGTNTGDQTLPTDFVSKASGGVFDGNIYIRSASSSHLFIDAGGSDADSDAGIVIRKSTLANSWYIGQFSDTSDFRIYNYTTAADALTIDRTNSRVTANAGLTVTGGEISADGLSSTYGDFSTNVEIAGSLTKGSGTFLIQHPLKSKEKTHRLAHSFVEAPRGTIFIEVF